MRESFVARVRDFHRDWCDRRQYDALAALAEPERSERILLLLHAWATDAAAAVAEVYGPALDVVVGTIEPRFAATSTGFAVTLGGAFALEFHAGGASADAASARPVVATLRIGDGLRETPLARPSRHVTWTREQVEDLLMRLLAVYERSRDAALARSPTI